MMSTCCRRQQLSGSNRTAAGQKIASASIQYTRQRSSSNSSRRRRHHHTAAAANGDGDDEHAAANALLAAASAPLRDAYPLAVRAATVAGGYRGLVATRALREGDVALAVPLVNALAVPGSCSSGSDGGGGTGAAAAAALIEPWQATHGIELPDSLSRFLASEAEWDVRLAAWLLWLLRRARQQQQQQRASSDGSGSSLWDLYASMLPRPDECASFFDFADDEAEAWLPYAKWRDRQRNAAAARDKAARLVLDALACAADADATAAAAWAYSLVRSRTFGRPLEAGSGAISTLLVPGADLVNHSLWPNAAFAVAAAAAAAAPPDAAADRNRAPPLLTVRATRAIAAGDEVAITYGRDRPNESLLSNYGFVLGGNPNEALTLPRVAAVEGWRRCVAPRTTVPLRGESEGSSLPAITEWHLRASPDEIVAADPSLRNAPAWWRRRSALTALSLMPPADDAGSGSPEIVGSPDTASLFASLSVYRQMQRLVGQAEARIVEDQERGWGCPARRAAAASAAREEVLLLAEVVDVCECELEALGVAVS